MIHLTLRWLLAENRKNSLFIFSYICYLYVIDMRNTYFFGTSLVFPPRQLFRLTFFSFFFLCLKHLKPNSVCGALIPLTCRLHCGPNLLLRRACFRIQPSRPNRAAVRVKCASDAAQGHMLTIRTAAVQAVSHLGVALWKNREVNESANQTHIRIDPQRLFHVLYNIMIFNQ